MTFVKFYYHDGGFPVINLREVSDVEYELDLSKPPEECERLLTSMLQSVRTDHPKIHQQMFAIRDMADNAQIIGAEVTDDHRLQKPMMRYLKQSISHQAAHGIQNLSRQ